MSETKNPGSVKIGVVGGDRRLAVAAEELAEEGFEVAVFALDTARPKPQRPTRCADLSSALRDADLVVLPLPVCTGDDMLNCPLSGEKINIFDLISETDKKTILAGGKIPPEVREKAESLGIKTVDYYDREDINVLNAIPTAEGALAIAMSELKTTIHGSRTAVLGFGRIGKTLSHSLAALGSDVTAVARKSSDLAWAKFYGYTPVGFAKFKKSNPKFDVIFNTVPALVLDEEFLRGLDRGTVIIDLASKPGGVDFDAAQRFEIRTIKALSLPGKVAPVTSGRIIKDGILNILETEGVIFP